MKKIFKYMFVGLFGVLCMSSCSSDLLETAPTESMSGTTFMSDATNALIPLNGIYRSMYSAGWSTTGNTHQCFGISAYNLMAEVMGDDMIMGAQGSGWFWFDARYNVKTRYTSGAWRSYDLWTAYYKWIAGANYIIDATQEMGGSTEDKNYAIGQAYAIRGYSYFMLAQIFARTYAGHQTEKCVPIYTEPTFTSTTGQPRSTVEEVYKQICNDLDSARLLLPVNRQDHVSHMSYAVASGIYARVCMVMQDWHGAIKCAQDAIDYSGCSIAKVSEFLGCNDTGAKNVMWGAEVVTDQAGMYASLFAHMAQSASYGASAPKQIARSLYDHMNSTDDRKQWWDPDDQTYNFSTSNDISGYVQKKMDFSNRSTWEGDYIWMRVEEMYLTLAEAACHLGQDDAAREYLMDVMSQRDANYSCDAYSGNNLSTMTSFEAGSLLEEILLQRRIELWGEDGRIYTIRRLRQGFSRPASEGWPLALQNCNTTLYDPESYAWVLTIPQAEFDGNENLNFDDDQNPIGNYPDEK